MACISRDRFDFTFGIVEMIYIEHSTFSPVVSGSRMTRYVYGPASDARGNGDVILPLTVYRGL